MSAGLDRAFSLANVRLAWLRTRTNAESLFKNYFRHIYRAYSLAEESNLTDLRNRLVKDFFEPSHPAKLYFPKKSGLQRTITLLNVEDQIAYQAMVNVVADRLLPQIKQNYFKSVFGHVYAGKGSQFFYRSWKVSYRKFTDALRQAYNDGYKYTASFDLTACYDSIDHYVLRHFLSALKLEPEFCDRLCRYLRHWTTSSGAEPIYQGHGIPQGPLPSGLLAEAVLRYFDHSNPKSSKFRYFRYVDDIRLFSKSEKELRNQLVSLDLRSKQIGLFPQASKIDIHLVVDINEELKTISNPLESVVMTPEPDQDKVRKRLVELSPSFYVKNETRFKYVLGRALPNAKLSQRLLTIFGRQPHLYRSIFNYLAKATKLPKSTSQYSMQLLKQNDYYPAVTASLIEAIRNRIHLAFQRELEEYCLKILRSGKNNNPELRVATVSVLLLSRALKWNQVKFNVNWQREWWVRTMLIGFIDKDVWGEPNYEHLLNILLRDKAVDVAVVAAELVIAEGVTVTKPVRQINEIAQFTLKRAGLIGKVQAGRCLVAEAMSRVLGTPLAAVNWKGVLGRHYKEMRVKVARWRGYEKADATAWINLTDVINDILLDALFRHDGTNIGGYTLGNIGGALASTSRFARKYPALWDAVREVHDKRLASDLSHPITKSTGKATKHIEFKDIRPIKKKLAAGYMELWNSW